VQANGTVAGCSEYVTEAADGGMLHPNIGVRFGFARRQNGNQAIDGFEEKLPVPVAEYVCEAPTQVIPDDPRWRRGCEADDLEDLPLEIELLGGAVVLTQCEYIFGQPGDKCQEKEILLFGR
jgi:hypothetical protein